MSNDMGMSGFLDRQAQAGGQEPTRLQNMGGGIGSLLEPIQAHLIQRYNEAKVVPLLNNFERQLMQLGSPQGGMGGYGGGPQRAYTPEDFGQVVPGQPLLGGPQQEALRQSLAAQNSPMRATTMGPESFGPPLALINRLTQIS